jgi:ABC-type glutathione transport system ATPase component
MLIDSNYSKVLNEIERANQESNKIGITDEKGNTNQGEYAVRIKNLQKFYLTGCCGSNPMLAIKNMSFCVEPGECFG